MGLVSVCMDLCILGLVSVCMDLCRYWAYFLYVWTCVDTGPSFCMYGLV